MRAWSNENTIYIGRDAKGTPRFSGLGVASDSEAELNMRLIDKLESNPDKVKEFLAKFAMRDDVIAQAKANNVTPEVAAKGIYEMGKQMIGFAFVIRLKTGV